MSKWKSNPWLDRFAGLEDAEQIRDRATLAGAPLVDIKRIPRFQIKRAVETALESFYLPSDEDVTVLQHLVDSAKAHCWERYATREDYLKGLYTPVETYKPKLALPTCLTGPAGVGKSSLLSALQRVMPGSSEIDLGTHHPVVQQKALWRINVEDQTSTSAMFTSIVENELGDGRRITNAQMSRTCAKAAHRMGISMLLVDELQFLTQSTTASTLVAKTLYQFGYIGVPFTFVANFSLCRSLLKREEQDTQRLLSAPIVLLPPSANSEDWVAYLTEVRKMLCDSFDVDIESERLTIYRLTAGLKRLLIRLVSIAYANVWRQGRNVVRIEDLANAYSSIDFAANREQVSAMLSPHPTKNTLRFQCPFPISPARSHDLEIVREDIRAVVLRDKLQQEMMTPDELKERQRKTATKLAVASSVAKMPKPPRPGPVTSAELLRSNARRTGAARSSGKPREE